MNLICNKINFSMKPSPFFDDYIYQSNKKDTYFCRLRGERCETVEGFLQEISAALKFPSYFGWNWAALRDCLGDLTWLGCPHTIIILDQADRFFQKDEQGEPQRRYEILLEVFYQVLAQWDKFPQRNSGTSLTFVFNTTNPEFLNELKIIDACCKEKVAVENEKSKAILAELSEHLRLSQ